MRLGRWSRPGYCIQASWGALYSSEEFSSKLFLGKSTFAPQEKPSAEALAIISELVLANLSLLPSRGLAFAQFHANQQNSYMVHGLVQRKSPLPSTALLKCLAPSAPLRKPIAVQPHLLPDDTPQISDEDASALLRFGRTTRRRFFAAVRPFLQRHVEASIMLRAGGHRPGGRYLELGSGLGFGAPIALDRFGADQFVGIDVDAELVERARAVYGQQCPERVQFEVANAKELPFADNSFRGVLQYAMLHHVRAWRTVLAETVRVLEPGGVLYFEEFLEGLILARPIKAMFPHPYDTQFSSKELIEAIGDAGLELMGKPLVIGQLAMAGAAKKPE